MHRSLILIAVSALVGAGLFAPAGAGDDPVPPAGNGPTVHSDFNGDGYSDLAIGVPGEDLAAIEDAGAVHIMYGTANGLVTLGNEFWHQDSTAGTPIQGAAEEDDLFGSALASGDFNNNGYSDLAIAAPGEDLGVSETGVGQVHILYGTSNGLSGTGNELLWQNATLDGAAVKDAAETGDRFGENLAVGNFGSSGRLDLAVGVPGENAGGDLESGAVAVFYSDANGITATKNQLWHQDSAKKGVKIKDKTEPEDEFGDQLTAGNFGKSFHDDLAVGIQNENVASESDGGAVSVLFGAKKGITPKGNQFWHQDSKMNGVGVVNSVDEEDSFGAALTAGNFGKSKHDDLAIGVTGEMISGEPFAGAVNVLYGSASGLVTKGNQIWHEDSPGTPPIEDSAENSDQLGSEVTAANFGKSSHDDLVIGVANETFEPEVSLTGAVHVIYGKNKGLRATGNQLWHQDTLNVQDDREDFDFFGGELAWGYFGHSDEADLVVGVVGEDVNGDSAGAVNVIYGAPAAMDATGNQFWHQDSEADFVAIQDETEPNDGFGAALDD